MIQIVADTPYEKWRADTLFTKEPGTVSWIQRECQAGDVFYDVGANIGQYTLMAARQVLPGGCVVAFEPHLANAVSFLKNMAANHTTGVTLITSALHDTDTFLPFNYQRLMAGSSGSQLGHAIDEGGETFVPEAIETKHATTLDRLVSTGTIPAPALVKIDVDGNELSVLGGLVEQLIHAPALRSVQVEVHPSSHANVTEFMRACGWREVETHYTAKGQAQLAKGIDPRHIFRNVIYGRSRYE